MLALISYNVAYFFVLGWVGEEGQGEEGGGGGGGGKKPTNQQKDAYPDVRLLLFCLFLKIKMQSMHRAHNISEVTPNAPPTDAPMIMVGLTV